MIDEFRLLQNPEFNERKIYTATEACRLLDISKSKLSRLATKGLIEREPDLFGNPNNFIYSGYSILRAARRQKPEKIVELKD